MMDQSFGSSYRIYSVSTDNILMWIRDVQYAIKMRQFTIEYVCVLFVGDGHFAMLTNVVLPSGQEVQ
jgi:hypothetical protein